MRLKGIGPLSHPWQGRVLPLNHSRDSASVSQGREGNKGELGVVVLATRAVLSLFLFLDAVTARAATTAIYALNWVPGSLDNAVKYSHRLGDGSIIVEKFSYLPFVGGLIWYSDTNSCKYIAYMSKEKVEELRDLSQEEKDTLPAEGERRTPPLRDEDLMPERAD